jgi:alpha-1,6-mannosyltransferase
MTTATAPTASKSSWHAARSWQTNAALLIFGVGLVLLSSHLVTEYHHFTIGFSRTSGLSALLYIASIFLVLTQPVDRLTLPIILIVAIAARITPLLAEPYLSSDIYRYVWDGIVQHAHISPYRYVPGDPALAFLRAPHQQMFDHINRRFYARTIYPPIAQAFFYLVTAISPTILAMKTAMVLCEAVIVAALLKILQHLNLRREQILLCAWCPLLIWEIAGAGHLDSAAMACIALALLCRLRRQPVLTGLFLGLAVMLKFYPIVLTPALMIPRNQLEIDKKWAFLNPSLWNWRFPAAMLAVVALGYAAYSSAGLLVFGYLNGYAHEEGMTTGTRYFLLDLVRHIPGLENLPTAAFFILCILIFAAIKLWALRSAAKQGTVTILAANQGEEAAFLTPAFAFAAALMLLFSPHYPWYIAWLVPFFTLLPILPILTYLMAFFYLFTTQLADGSLAKMYILNKILYTSVASATLIYFALRNRLLPGLDFHQSPK